MKAAGSVPQVGGGLTQILKSQCPKIIHKDTIKRIFAKPMPRSEVCGDECQECIPRRVFYNTKICESHCVEDFCEGYSLLRSTAHVIDAQVECCDAR